MIDPVSDLRAAVRSVAASLPGETNEGTSALTLERPPQAEFGDYSTNAAMLLAPTLGEKPRDVAERLSERLVEDLGESVEKIEVAGPGFLNLFLSDGWHRRAVDALAEAGDRLGSPTELGGERVNVEFVSANPTGPLTAASGRHAAYGDSVARLLERTGGVVEREYYVNDVGGQIERFAESIAARMAGEPLPSDGYEGEYVAELADRIASEGVSADDLPSIAARATALMRERAESTLRRFGAEFDRWSSESELHSSGAIDQVLPELSQRGHTYESEGATWLRTTSFGDDKDRVLVRSGGEPTYYLSDIAYHREKLERSPGGLIDVLGADHHGYVDRLKAGLQALELDAGLLEIVIVQLVHVVEAGERAQMSKRKGEFVTLDELIDDIGPDAARFFMLQRSHDTPVDLDLELARRQSNENPVYYVQYAHARISSILRRAGEKAVAAALEDPADPPATPLHENERALMRRLLELPSETLEAAGRRAPHRLCAYATSTASDFHLFYRDCKVLGAEGGGVEAERIRLCHLTKRAIASTLDLLGIAAPDQM